MRKIKDLIIASYQEFRNVRCITVAGVFGAISIVLGLLTIMIGDFLKIGFTFLPNEFIFYLFGPVVGAIFGAAMDILTFFIKPTGTYFFGFTVSAILTGILYGFTLYKRPISLTRLFIVNLIHMVFINLLLNSFWLTILIGKGFLVLLSARFAKDLIMLPVETGLLFAVIKGVEVSGVLKLLHGGKLEKVRVK
jgi:ECF transporter S component (folate family)